MLSLLKLKIEIEIVQFRVTASASYKISDRRFAFSNPDFTLIANSDNLNYYKFENL